MFHQILLTVETAPKRCPTSGSLNLILIRSLVARWSAHYEFRRDSSSVRQAGPMSGAIDVRLV